MKSIFAKNLQALLAANIGKIGGHQERQSSVYNRGRNKSARNKDGHSTDNKTNNNDRGSSGNTTRSGIKRKSDAEVIVCFVCGVEGHRKGDDE